MKIINESSSEGISVALRRTVHGKYIVHNVDSVGRYSNSFSTEVYAEGYIEYITRCAQFGLEIK